MMKKSPRKKKSPRAPLTSKARAVRAGYRSGLEDRHAEQIAAAGLEVLYETEKISYVIPETAHKYTPDFKLPKTGGFFYIESKGRWVTKDRQKHLLIKKQQPDLDIRFVFSDSRQKLYKGSPTSYAKFCERHGFLYADKVIPNEWLQQCS